jgi:hypothetical protein
MRRFSVLIASLSVTLATLSVVAAADAPAKNDKQAAAKQAAKTEVEVISVTIHPAAAPRPALKYHLLPTFQQTTPGNAVPLYAKALVFHLETWNVMQNAESDEKDKQSSNDLNHFEKWLETPLDKLPRDRVKKFVKSFDGFGKSQIELATRREHCNWDMPLRQGHVFEMLLPEVQEFRNMARVVALRARLQIAEGKYDEAIDSLETGYGMARHVAKQPFLVSNLVGTVIAGMMNDQLLTLCQQRGAPNLYWSIVELPSPWNDRQECIRAEYDGVYLQWPELQTVRSAQYAPEQWNLLLRKVVAQTVRYRASETRQRLPEAEQAAEIERIVAKALDAVPQAKADLVAGGRTQKDVDAMPAAQIALLHALDTCDRLRDDLLKWWNLPYWQACKGIEAANRELEAAKKQETIPLATALLPMAISPLYSFVATDRQFAALRCIEALRMYAAAHNGELPATLDEITEVPIPLNPVTGRPFPYHLEGKTAVLDADGGLTTRPRPQYRVSVAK